MAPRAHVQTRCACLCTLPIHVCTKERLPLNVTWIVGVLSSRFIPYLFDTFLCSTATRQILPGPKDGTLDGVHKKFACTELIFQERGAQKTIGSP